MLRDKLDSKTNGMVKEDTSSVISATSPRIERTEDEGDLSPARVARFFKEMQHMYKVQMDGLMERQRREQEKMQEAFKRQQVLLLARMSKVLPSGGMANGTAEAPTRHHQSQDKDTFPLPGPPFNTTEASYTKNHVFTYTLHAFKAHC